MTELRSAEQRWLTRALLALTLGGLGALLVTAVRFAGGGGDSPADAIRVDDLKPRHFKLAPTPPRRDGDSAASRTRLLLLRDAAGLLRVFELPYAEGRLSVPLAADPQLAGLPCADFAPDFDAGELACQQAVPGFEFARRHRWSLDGVNRSGSAPDLQRAPGREGGGDWVPDFRSK